jgi:hypothetical protein
VDLVAAVDTCRRPAVLKRTLTIAAIVGTVLSLINEGGAILHANVTGAAAWKIALNFVVPFIVSNLGVLAGDRTARA